MCSAGLCCTVIWVILLTECFVLSLILFVVVKLVSFVFDDDFLVCFG